MPAIHVDQEYIFDYLGKRYTTEEFRELCFEFGIELEEETSEYEMAVDQIGEAAAKGKGLSHRRLYKIDVPANRYDLLCREGIAQALKIFLGLATLPTYQLVPPKDGKFETIFVQKEVSSIRPFIAGAILRNIQFTEASYASFIAFQDKLHQTVCRKRSLVAIGTYDLDTLKGPFTYTADLPGDIRFQPLTGPHEMTGPEILKYYRSQSLGQYIPLLEAHARYPIFKDSVHQVCSLPPLINGASSKLTLQTRNVLVECTGTDWPRLCTVLTLVVTLFSTYTVPQGWIEPMHVFHLMDMPSEQTVTPLFKSLSFQVPLHEVRSVLGIPHLSLSTMQHELIRMGYSMALSSLDSMEKKQKDTSHEAASPTVEVHVPVTRPDVLHVRDVIEDVGIAYGYGRLLEESGVVLPQTMTVGQANPLNQLSAHVRHCMAQAGYMEVLSSTLCEWVPSFDHPYFGQPVTLANPSTITFQTVRTSLIPTLLSVFQEHPHCPLPLKLFEVGDAVRQHPDMEVLSCNVRKLTFAIMHTVSMVQTVHGTLEFIMQQWFPDQPYQLVPSALCVAPTTPTTTNCTTPHFSSKDREKKEDLSVSPLFFQDRGVDIWVQNSHVGVMGVIHPHLLKLWHLHFPITLVEINVEPFL